MDLVSNDSILRLQFDDVAHESPKWLDHESKHVSSLLEDTLIALINLEMDCVSHALKYL